MDEATQPDVPAALPPAPLRTQPHGGKLRTGNPGNRGGGKLPEWFSDLARRKIASRKLIDRLARIASAEIGEIHRSIDPLTGAITTEYTETPIKEQRQAIELLCKIGRVLSQSSQREPLPEGGLQVYVMVTPPKS